MIRMITICHYLVVCLFSQQLFDQVTSNAILSPQINHLNALKPGHGSIPNHFPPTSHQQKPFSPFPVPHNAAPQLPHHVPNQLPPGMVKQQQQQQQQQHQKSEETLTIKETVFTKKLLNEQSQQQQLQSLIANGGLPYPLTGPAGVPIRNPNDLLAMQLHDLNRGSVVNPAIVSGLPGQMPVSFHGIGPLSAPSYGPGSAVGDELLRRQHDSIDRKMIELQQEQELKERVAHLKKMQKAVDQINEDGATTLDSDSAETTELPMNEVKQKMEEMEKRMDQMEQGKTTDDDDDEATTDDDDAMMTTDDDDEATKGAAGGAAGSGSTDDKDDASAAPGVASAGSPGQSSPDAGGSGGSGSSDSGSSDSGSSGSGSSGSGSSSPAGSGSPAAPLQTVVSGVFKVVQTVLKSVGSLTKVPGL